MLSHKRDESLNQQMQSASRSNNGAPLRDIHASSQATREVSYATNEQKNDNELYKSTPFLHSLISDPSSALIRTITSNIQSTYSDTVESDLRSTPVSIILQEQNQIDADAEAFARTAPLAGYLSKLSKCRSRFQRYFFVLKPSTHLYYFRSPRDIEPRGCIDLDDSATTVRMLEKLPDGRTRFGIRLANNSSPDDSHSQTVVLEARSDEICQDWVKAIQTEKLTYCQEELHLSHKRTIGFKQRIQDLELKVKNFRMVEQDRDGALEDAAQWKSKYENLNESLRKLTLHLRRENDPNNLAEIQQPNDKHGGLRLELNKSGNKNEVSMLSDSEIENAISLEESFNQSPGSHISALHNACQQLKENVRLASHEAATAVQDLTTKATSLELCENRLHKAEKHMCKLWEETTSLREAVKVSKQEKRILVREVKELRAKIASLPKDSVVDNSLEASNYLEAENSMEEGGDSEGERLMGKLEEELESGIRLHEEFLAKKEYNTESPKQTEIPITISPIKFIESPSDSEIKEVQSTINRALLTHDDIKPDANSVTGSGRSSPLQPKILSLLDYDESEDDATCSSDGDEMSSVGENSVKGSKSEISGRNEDDIRLDHKKRQLWHKLEEESVNREDSETTISLTSQSVVTDNGQATSRLDCPLADVVETLYEKTNIAKDDGIVYHLTFYSRKIGLQFQKVPPKSSITGMLTEAMTVDLRSNNIDNSQTSSELRRISELTKGAKEVENDIGENRNNLEKPVHAVLVCGFLGFDDTANHIRPKLGARLVAFDGVSVEKGKWTFDNIRRAIQSRGRPLTLSFRNDFLTTEQRVILTRAVEEVNDSIPPLRRVIQHRKPNQDRFEGTSYTTEQSYESEQSLNDSYGIFNARTNFEDEDSISSSHYRGMSTSNSVATNIDPRTFSEAGSSVFSTNIGPLLSNLMSNISSPSSKISNKPPYLSGGGKSLGKMAGHHDFHNSLL